MNAKKYKAMVMERENSAPTVGVEMKLEFMDVASFFKYLASFYSGDGGLQEDVKMRIGEGLTNF